MPPRMPHIAPPSTVILAHEPTPRATAARVLALTIGGLLLCGAADPTGTQPATSPPAAALNVIHDPAAMLNALADHLDADPNHVALQIGPLPITQDDLAGVIRTMPPSMGNLSGSDLYHRALDVMARQKAMVLHARQEHLDQDPTLIHEGQIAFERIISDAWLKRQADAAVTEEALRARFDHDFANSPGPAEVRARIILVPTEVEANTVIQQLRAGADFIELARAHSKDPTAANGGDLGFVTSDATTPELGAVMFSLAPGQFTAYPVATLMGYFVIRVEGRRNRQPLTFEEARPRLERELRAEAVKTSIGALLANVKVVLPAAAAKP
jgi:peptidyl-prolyl cis-trans isomerase C